MKIELRLWSSGNWRVQEFESFVTDETKRTLLKQKNRIHVPVCTMRPEMKSADTVVRPATESDLPSIERHYGPLNNAGDSFCDIARMREVRFDWLLIAEVDGEYAGFLYWHLGKKPFFAHELANFAQIREVQVLKKFRGKGIGR